MVEISEIKFILNVLALSVVFCITLIIGFLLFRLFINLLEKVYIKLSIKMLEVKREKLIKKLSDSEIKDIESKIDRKCENCMYFYTGNSEPKFSIGGECKNFNIPTIYDKVCDSFKSNPNNIIASSSNFRPSYNKPSSETLENLFKDCKVLNDSDKENNTKEE